MYAVNVSALNYLPLSDPPHLLRRYEAISAPIPDQKMLRFPFPNRCLLQTLPTVTQATQVVARSNLVSNATFPAVQYIKRDSLAACCSQSHQTSVLNYSIAQRRSIHNDPKGTESKSDREDSGTKNSTVYRNKHGEEIVFCRDKPPPGYVFVPSGNPSITRNCRKLAQKLYAVYRPKSRKKISSQIGLYVPRNVFEKVRSDFAAKRARIDAELWRTLDKKYPQMPPADKSEFHDLFSSQYRSLTGKSALNDMEIRVLAYVRDRYTPFKCLDLQDTKAISLVLERVAKILASWRGEG